MISRETKRRIKFPFSFKISYESRSLPQYISTGRFRIITRLSRGSINKKPVGESRRGIFIAVISAEIRKIARESSSMRIFRTFERILNRRLAVAAIVASARMHGRSFSRRAIPFPEPVRSHVRRRKSRRRRRARPSIPRRSVDPNKGKLSCPPTRHD